MNSYWIWSNSQAGWRMAHQRGYTTQLHEAGRFQQDVAEKLVESGNLGRSNVEYPDLVKVLVNNTFLTPEAQQIMLKYQETGDRKVIDDAYRVAQEDKALVANVEFQESLQQMLRGEGRVIREAPPQ